MKKSLIIIIALSALLCSCGSKKESTRLATSTDSAQTLAEIEDSVSLAMGATKADEYYEQEGQIAEEVSVNENREHTFGGRMVKQSGDYLLITMYLKAEKGEVWGQYFYQRNPKKEDILLKGRILGDSLTLTEYDAQNNITGHFNGNIIGNDTFEGNWSSPNGKRSLFFKLFYDSKNYEERKIIGLKVDEFSEPAGEEGL
jgi:hypothetical protein